MKKSSKKVHKNQWIFPMFLSFFTIFVFNQRLSARHVPLV